MTIAHNFTWTASREQAAGLVAADVLTDEQIAQRIGITRRTLALWKTTPAFMERVNAQVAAERAAVAAEGIANKQNRVAALNDRWQRMQMVIAERAGDMAGVPGGETGLLVRQVKGIGAALDFQVVEEYAVDIGLMRELREHEKQAAQELGQWTDEAGGGTGVVIIRNYIGVKVAQDD